MRGSTIPRYPHTHTQSARLLDFGEKLQGQGLSHMYHQLEVVRCPEDHILFGKEHMKKIGNGPWQRGQSKYRSRCLKLAPIGFTKEGSPKERFGQRDRNGRWIRVRDQKLSPIVETKHALLAVYLQAD